MKEEIWKPVVGYEGLYEVSNLGKVKNNKKIISSVDDGNGYLRLHLSKEGKVKSFRVHRLVAEAFIENPYGLPKVNHIDGNKKNNVVDNLEWCTQAENVEHAYSSGLSTRNVPRQVKAIDANGNVQYFTSQCDASRKTGIAQQNISMCCLGKIKSAGGYIWQFIE